MVPSESLVPYGYSGNLNSSQAEALVALSKELQSFAQQREPESVAEPANAEETLVTKPVGPIVPGTPSEEASEARLLAASESNMLRFLRARNFDVAKATAMAIDSCKWRASVKPGQITPEMIPNALPSGCWRFVGYAKDGMPIILIDAALFKPSSYYGIDEYIRYVAYFIEVAVGRMGCGVERLLAIFVLGGFSLEMMRPFATRCVGQLISICQSQYPERLGACVFCNAPWIFHKFWNIIRPWIDPITYSRIQFADANPADRLLQYIDDNQLSSHLGGSHEEYPLQTRSVHEEIESHIAALGGRDKVPVASDMSAITGIVVQTLIGGGSTGTSSGEVLIRPKTRFALEVSIEQNTKVLAWNFKTVAYDIAFGYKVVVPEGGVEDAQNGSERPSDGHEALALTLARAEASTESDVKEVLPLTLERVDASREGGVKGDLTMEKSWVGGRLHLVFDNSYAMFRGKTLTYSIRVET